MALVFRKDQSTPLTNDQLDGNFEYLRDQTLLKYSTSNFTAANISAQLNTLGLNSSTLTLAEANAINAWAVRDLAPSSVVPSSTDKSSLVSRNSTGGISVSSVTGDLIGNASTATLASGATKLQNSRNINGIGFDGTASIVVYDGTKLPLAGGSMAGKITLVPAEDTTASINFGTSTISPSLPVNGDMWGTTSGLYFKITGVTYKIAHLDSPTFTGVVLAPGYTGAADQVITLSHLDAAEVVLNNSIALKSNLNSPTFTGTPLAPTPASSDSTTKIATTSFVQTAVTNKASDLTSAYQLYTNSAVTTFSNSNNIALALKSNLNSPEFTGVPRAPTAETADNSTQIATTAFTNSAIFVLQSQLNGAIAALNNAIAATRPVPVGAVFYMLKATIPYGYLEANGQAVSRATYADLWNYLGQPDTGNGSTTFNVIDLRAEFIRGWDDGRGVDTNRVIGSYQESQNLAHSHSYTLRNGGNNPWWQYNNAAPVSGYQETQTGSSGGNESRPRNVALMPIIKW